MTINDILNSDLSDSLKIQMIKIFQEGGKTEKENSELLQEEQDSVMNTVLNSDAEFVKRLLDSNRQVINNPDGSISTHKLSYGEMELDGKTVYFIYPDILEIDGELVDLSSDRELAKLSALEHNDYVIVDTEKLADWFTKNYKDYIDSFQQYNDIPSEKEGGEVNINTPKPTAIVTVGDKEYKVCIADTPEKRKKGLSKCKDLPEDGGMLFVFEELSTTPFTMAETSIDLDIIFIDEEGVTIENHSVNAHDPEPVVCNLEYAYVLEVNYGSGIEGGLDISISMIDEDEDADYEISDEDKLRIARSKMLVLDENGDVQMKLVGGERIMSIISTKKLIKLALKAYRDEADSDYIKVGKFVMKEFNALDDRTPLYVEAPEKKDK